MKRISRMLWKFFAGIGILLTLLAISTPVFARYIGWSPT